MRKTKFIAYYRVSTEQQSSSGLGLKSQKSSETNFLKNRQGSLIAQYTDVYSGKSDERPQLRIALEHCKNSEACLIIAKMDRLSRKVRFICELLESSIKFVSVESPQASIMEWQLRAVIAEEELRLISERTKAALAEKKRQGFKLGSPYPQIGGRKSAAIRKMKSKSYLKHLELIINDIRRHSPLLSHKQLAIELNKRNISTATGKTFNSQVIGNILYKIRKINKKED